MENWSALLYGQLLFLFFLSHPPHPGLLDLIVCKTRGDLVRIGGNSEASTQSNQAYQSGGWFLDVSTESCASWIGGKLWTGELTSTRRSINLGLTILTKGVGIWDPTPNRGSSSWTLSVLVHELIFLSKEWCFCCLQIVHCVSGFCAWCEMCDAVRESRHASSSGRSDRRHAQNNFKVLSSKFCQEPGTLQVYVKNFPNRKEKKTRVPSEVAKIRNMFKEPRFVVFVNVTWDDSLGAVSMFQSEG